MIPASSGMGAASITKSVPVVGTAVSAVVMPALSAGATYAIGMAFIQHFASGGTLIDFNPRQYREFLKTRRSIGGRDRGRSALQPHVPRPPKPDHLRVPKRHPPDHS